MQHMGLHFWSNVLQSDGKACTLVKCIAMQWNIHWSWLLAFHWIGSRDRAVRISTVFAITRNVCLKYKKYKSIQIQNTKLDWIADRAVRQREDINCVRNHSVRNAAIMHYTGARHWNFNFLSVIHCIALHCIQTWTCKRWNTVQLKMHWCAYFFLTSCIGPFSYHGCGVPSIAEWWVRGRRTYLC